MSDGRYIMCPIEEYNEYLDFKENEEELSRGYQNALDNWKRCREQTKKLKKEIELLKRENKALADDNEMKCELNEKLSKALDKACVLLVETTSQVNDIFDEMLDEYSWITSKDEWKEFLLDETN